MLPLCGRANTAISSDVIKVSCIQLEMAQEDRWEESADIKFSRTRFHRERTQMSAGRRKRQNLMKNRSKSLHFSMNTQMRLCARTHVTVWDLYWLPLGEFVGKLAAGIIHKAAYNRADGVIAQLEICAHRPAHNFEDDTRWIQLTQRLDCKNVPARPREVANACSSMRKSCEIDLGQNSQRSRQHLQSQIDFSCHMLEPKTNVIK